MRWWPVAARHARSRTIAWSVAAAILVVAAGCARSQSQSGTSSDAAARSVPEPNGGEQPAEDVIGNPIGSHAIEVTSLDEVQLPFQPIAPAGLGTPVKILVSPVDRDAEPKIAWIFDDPTFGTFHVSERITSLTDELLAGQAGMKSGCTTQSLDPGAYGEGAYSTGCVMAGMQMLALGDGRSALVMPGDDVTTVMWLAKPTILDASAFPGVKAPMLTFELVGATAAMDPQQAAALAARV